MERGREESGCPALSQPLFPTLVSAPSGELTLLHDCAPPGPLAASLWMSVLTAGCIVFHPRLEAVRGARSYKRVPQMADAPGPKSGTEAAKAG